MRRCAPRGQRCPGRRALPGLVHPGGPACASGRQRSAGEDDGQHRRVRCGRHAGFAPLRRSEQGLRKGRPPARARARRPLPHVDRRRRRSTGCQRRGRTAVVHPFVWPGLRHGSAVRRRSPRGNGPGREHAQLGHAGRAVRDRRERGYGGHRGHAPDVGRGEPVRARLGRRPAAGRLREAADAPGARVRARRPSDRRHRHRRVPSTASVRDPHHAVVRVPAGVPDLVPHVCRGRRAAPVRRLRSRAGSSVPVARRGHRHHGERRRIRFAQRRHRHAGTDRRRDRVRGQEPRRVPGGVRVRGVQGRLSEARELPHRGLGRPGGRVSCEPQSAFAPRRKDRRQRQPVWHERLGLLLRLDRALAGPLARVHGPGHRPRRQAAPARVHRVLRRAAHLRVRPRRPRDRGEHHGRTWARGDGVRSPHRAIHGCRPHELRLRGAVHGLLRWRARPRHAPRIDVPHARRHDRDARTAARGEIRGVRRCPWSPAILP